jgi:parallel beta-helix repeat protein
MAPLLVLLVLPLLLASCDPGGSQGRLSSSGSPGAQAEQQVVTSLLTLYQQTIVQEDIDRLQALLQPGVALRSAAGTARQTSDGTFVTLESFRQTWSDTFRRRAITAVDLQADHIQIAGDHRSVTFVEVVSSTDPTPLVQQTHIFRTTFRLDRQENAGVVTLRIAGVQRQGPLATITTPGQVQAGAWTRLQVSGTSEIFPLNSVAMVGPDAVTVPLRRSDAFRFHGTYVASSLSSPQSLVVRLRSDTGEELAVPHYYRIRGAGEGVVQRLPEMGPTRFFAVTVANDGTVWAGGDMGARLYRVAPGASSVTLHGPLLAAPEGRVEDLTLDERGRLHAVVFSPQASGVIVLDHEVGCQTVNVLDTTYPLRTAAGRPSASTRAIGVGGQAIWLHGSDAGLARVSDALAAGHCPPDGVAVTYEPVLRRQDGLLPANTVPALLAEADGTLWVGSALGLSRLQHGEMTLVPFDPALSFQGRPATLEAFFQALAQALVTAEPIETVAVGGVSFLEAFGSPVVKADLIFSLAEERPGVLWVGTLGGGLRRVEVRADGIVDTLHLTRADGLASNIIFALAMAPDGAVWAATDDGVSRIAVTDQDTMITNYTAVDGLPLPARDLAVDAAGTVWVATDGGLYRIAVPGGSVTGTVQDDDGQPVAGADVLVLGTPVRTVSDAAGHFVLHNLPPGSHRLQVDGRLATPEPFSVTWRDLVVRRGRQTLAPLVVTAGTPRVPVDPMQGGQVTFPLVPDASLQLPAGMQFPAGVPAELELTLLPAISLPVPLSPGFTAVAAAVIAPDGVTLPSPARLTLPTQRRLEAGQLVVLLRLDGVTGTYEQVGLGRVRADGAMIDTFSGGLTQLSTVVFASTAEQATRVFLVRVSGNNQHVQPGDTIPEPLVVRLEDQFGNPVVGEAVLATITQGDGALVAADPVTDANGEARFQVQVAAELDDLVVEVTTPAVPNVRPVQFLTIVGELDTPGFVDGLVVANDVAYVADGLVGDLLVIDVSNAQQPVLLHTIRLKRDRSPGEGPRSFALHGDRLYVGALEPARLYILDITNPRDADFAADRDGDGLADVILGIQELPGDVQGHFVKDVTVEGERVYAISNTQTSDPAMLYVVDAQDATAPRLLSATLLPAANPTGLAALGEAVYVAAEGTGLLIFDMHDPAAPMLLTTLGDPDPDDDIDITLSSDIVVAGTFAYVVETHLNRSSKESTNVFTIFDLHIPTSPVRRGNVAITALKQQQLFATGLTVAGDYAYVARGTAGLEALDIRDPDAPHQVGFVQTPSEALQVVTAGTFIYVTDTIFGLQVIQGPGEVTTDTDGDDVIDFFDALPTDPTETRDSDGDRVGDNADLDDDNDGFPDAEETAAVPPTDPRDPLSFPLRLPPPGVTTLIVDATTSLTARQRQGTPEAPYRSVTEALRALRSGLAPAVHTLRIRAGIYSPLTTQDVMPLEFRGLSDLMVQAQELDTVVLDGGLRGDVITVEFSEQLVIENLVVTRGTNGISVRESAHIVLRHNHITRNEEDGIRILDNATTGIVVTENLVEHNRAFGIRLTGNAAAIVTQNSSMANGFSGIAAQNGVTAEIVGNYTAHNGFFGILVNIGSRATVAENTVEHNRQVGIVVFGNATGAVSRNTVRFNGHHGMVVDIHATAELRDNIVVGNGFLPDPIIVSDKGIFVGGGAVATIHGGVIADNASHGIYVGLSPFGPGPATAIIGLDGDGVIEISGNGGAGIFVENNGSEARIDSRHIVFDGNGEGDTVGNVVDVAPEP